VLAEKSAIDNARLEEAGIEIIELEGMVREAYLDTIYGSKWAHNDQQEYTVHYPTLKSKVYTTPDTR
jgi:hypothetical protein